jgi:hypothetical protein
LFDTVLPYKSKADRARANPAALKAGCLKNFYFMTIPMAEMLRPEQFACPACVCAAKKEIEKIQSY